MIVQALYEAQEHNGGYLPKEALHALSERLRVPLRRLHEVASFFPHFRLEPPARVEVHVCRDMACHLKGATEVREALERLAADYPNTVAVHGTSCVGRCDRAPVACINEHYYHNRPVGELRQIIADFLSGIVPRPDLDANYPPFQKQWRCDPYDGNPTYEGVKKYVAAAGDKSREADDARAKALFKELEVADLRGMGGAGVPASRKWADVRAARGSLNEKYIVVNGDESEPATFKDRELLLRTPWLIVEGVILAGLSTHATRGYVYIRHEYQEQVKAVREEIRRAESMGVCGRNASVIGRDFPVEVFVSPGGYICGEQSALIEAMEDRRAEPRNKPPELLTNGLRDQPTLVSNVETFAWSPSIYLKGGQWYADQGVNGWKGARIFSVCGDVTRPGVYEVPMGLTMRELINDYCGGMKAGRPLRAFAPSGPSGGFLPPKIPRDTFPSDAPRTPAAAAAPAPPRLNAGGLMGLADLPETERPRPAAAARTFRAPKWWPGFLERHKMAENWTHLDVLDLELDLQMFRDLGLMLGAGMVVYGQGTDVVSQGVNSLEFYRNESCGKCVPCRLGSQKLVEIGTRLISREYAQDEWEATGKLVVDLGGAMEQTAICGLGSVASAPLTSLIRYFPQEVQRCVGKQSRQTAPYLAKEDE